VLHLHTDRRDYLLAKAVMVIDYCQDNEDNELGAPLVRVRCSTSISHNARVTMP